MQEHGSDSSRWIFAAYLPLLVWVPIPLGSNRPWAWAIIEIWVCLLTIWWLSACLRGRLSLGALRSAWPVLVLAAAWMGYVWIQLLPLPIRLLEVLSPESARWHRAAAFPETLIAAPLTLDRYATLDAACLSSAYVAFLVLSISLLNRERIQAAAIALVFSGVLQATYATVIDFSAGTPSHGTFVNRNHFANYLVLCLSAGIGALIGNLKGSSNKTWKQFLRNTIDWMLTRRMVFRLGLLAMVIALVLSRSRMANTAFFVSLLIAGTVALALSRRASRSMVILLVSLVALDLLVVGTYFGARQVVERIAQTTPESEDRDEVARYALDMWRDYPVFGAGLGSFRSVFPRYSGEGTSAAYTHAHNDYLEFAAETGIIGLLLLGAMVAVSLFAAVRAQYLRTDPLMRGASFAAMMGITAMLIHSSVEFNLQIPANALTFVLVIAFAWVSLSRPSEAGDLWRTVATKRT